MNLPGYFRSAMLRLFRRAEISEDVDAELGSHIEHRADDLELGGMDRAEAERRARIEFGARERYKEESYEALGGNFVQTAVQDVRFSGRVLRKSPGFAIAAVATLALAIGANSVVFAVLNGLFHSAIKCAALAGSLFVAAGQGSVYCRSRIRIMSICAIVIGVSMAWQLITTLAWRLDTGKNPASRLAL